MSLPLRHLTNPSPHPCPSQLTPSLNSDALKSLLKEHLTSLLTRGASTVQTHRPLSILPLEEIKEQSIRTIDSSAYLAQHKSTLGLTVTPLEISTAAAAAKNYQSISLEKMAQQRNFLEDNDSASSQISSRPSTQPGQKEKRLQFDTLKERWPLVAPTAAVPVSTLIHPYQAPRFLFKRTSPSTEIISSSEQHVQTIRKVPLHHRSTSKTSHQRNTASTTIELLPPIISGKRLHMPLANHRYL